MSPVSGVDWQVLNERASAIRVARARPSRVKPSVDFLI